jgi:hypothetical protein
MGVVYKTRGGLGLATPCILHVGSTNEDGYGRQTCKGKQEYAHRVAYAQAHGLTMEQIKDVIVRHLCDTPACRNPEHLIGGTQADNIRDKVLRGRQNRPKGEANSLAKLTEAQVIEIKRRISNGQYLSIIAKQFGVTASTISYIKRGKLWAHLVASTKISSAKNS